MIYIFIVVLLLIIGLCFLKYFPSFGATPSHQDKKNYALRTNNYKNNKFINEHEYQRIYRHYKQNQYLTHQNIYPTDKLPIQKTTVYQPTIDSFKVTWLGHSSIYLQMHGMNILIDPVLSDNISPISLYSVRRFSDVPIHIDELKDIDIVLITHDHFDHLDEQSIKKIDKKVKKYIVPLGIENHLKRWHVSSDKMISLAWWETATINGLHIACTPARHNSSRNFVLDSFQTLWASWVIYDEKYKIFDSGDTGFDTHFQEIYEKYGEFDLAILECGQYNNRWKSTHMIPEESVQAGMILHAKTLLPMHWGAFSLAEHPWNDSIERFVLQAKQKHCHYITPMIGETVDLTTSVTTTHWWKEIK